MKKLLILLSGVLLFAVYSCKQVPPVALTLPPIFSNHMVMQQKENIPIWGSYTPGNEINITGSWGESTTTTANENGKWKSLIQTPEAGGPFELKISTADSIITLSDVLSGEVWLASGQSNMEMPLTGFLPNEPIDNYEVEIANANYPQMREFKVPKSMSIVPESEYKGEWKVTSSETAAERSATAYFFARKIHQELNIPVGIIHTSWGGTPVESWMSKEKMIAMDEFKSELEAIDEEKVGVIKSWLSKFPTIAAPRDADAMENLDLQDSHMSDPGFDDSTWGPANLTNTFESLEGEGTNGAMWFRKTVSLDDISNDYFLEISEGIDDADVTFINGQKVGSTVCYNCPRRYRIPSSILKNGTNTIAIRMIDTGGPGGANGTMTLKSDNNVEIDIADDWKYNYIAGVGSSGIILFHAEPELAASPPEGYADYSMNANTPSVLYNAMIHPIIPFTIKGAIWYQGESNVGRHDQYLKLFPGMIADWRERWGQEFPLYFVQIAPFGYGNSGMSPALRDAQRKSLKTPKTGMAITMDIGHETSIHPGNKQDVGDRLAMLALTNDYDAAGVGSGPLYRENVINGKTIKIFFDHADSGLMAKHDLNGFEIAGEDQNYLAAPARIEGNTVIIEHSEIDKPMYFRYGWKDYFEASLFNMEGLPASSFSIE